MKKQDFWKIFDDKYSSLLMQLYERWQDEKDYEDIKDYLKLLQSRIIIEGVEVYAITKKPFGIKCKCEDGNMQIRIKNERYCIRAMAKSIA